MWCRNVCSWRSVEVEVRKRVSEEKKRPDIIALQETWLIGREEIRMEGYMWVGRNSGVGKNGRRRGGVGFLINERIWKMCVVMYSMCNERKMWIKYGKDEEVLYVCVVYNYVNGNNKQMEMYDDLCVDLEIIGDSRVCMVGDFNSRVGREFGGGEKVVNRGGKVLIKLCKKI